MEGGQGCGLEWVEGGPAQQRMAPPPAPGLPLDSVPAGKGRRAFWWPWTEPAQKAVPTEGLGGEGCLLCGVEGMAVDGSHGGWRRQGFWDVQTGSNCRWKWGWDRVPVGL